MISVQEKGDFSKLNRYLNRLKDAVKLKGLERVGQQGVAALSAATPVDTGKTASSWYYEIKRDSNTVTISFCNRNIQNGVPIAIILEYGHGTGTGGFVQGRKYIEPTIRPVFDKLTEEAWQAVTKV